MLSLAEILLLLAGRGEEKTFEEITLRRSSLLGCWKVRCYWKGFKRDPLEEPRPGQASDHGVDLVGDLDGVETGPPRIVLAVTSCGRAVERSRSRGNVEQRHVGGI